MKAEANRILEEIRKNKPETMCAKRQKEYVSDRRRFEEIPAIIEKYGYPQDWNADGRYGPERYIEAHIWTDRGVLK